MHFRKNGEGAEASWTLENDDLQVRLSRSGLDLQVRDKRADKLWRMEPERQGFLLHKLGMQFVRPLADLRLDGERFVREGDFAGVEVRSVQTDPWQQFKIDVRVLLAEDRPELLISVAPNEDPGYNAEAWIREVYYPRSFEHANSARSRTLLPFQQGTLLPGDWPTAYEADRASGMIRPWTWEAGTGPWWGHVDQAGAAYLAVMDTPDDAFFDMEHPAGGPTRIAPRWLTSFEAFRYPRRMLYRFFPNADHTDVALAYRDYCRRTGRWRSIEEKRLEKPQIEKLRGAIGIDQTSPGGHETNRPWVHALMVSLSGEKVRRRFRTFEQIAEMADATTAKYPDENIFLLLAAWQTLGYDHAHPAACPPSAEAGGWDGMRKVSDVAEKHDMLFGVHEQYRDFFYSSPFWSEERTRKDSRRDSPRHAYWAGGTQSILCPMLMLDFVKMNVQQLRDQKIRLNATYQDVLTAIQLEECYDANHPATRTQCREARDSILQYYRQLGWVIGSESAADWAAPNVDWFFVHWARVKPGVHGEPVGIPVPLFSLAFHDCAILMSMGTPPLLAALGGVNTLQPGDRDLRALHTQTAWMPLTGHRLLDDAGRKQESTFGDSVVVTADLDAESYRITGLEGGEVAGKLRDGRM